MPKVTRPVGCDGKEMEMNTKTVANVAAKSSVMSALLVTVMAAGLLFVTGHAQSSVLHDAAHDMRHATGFPCH